MIGSTLKRKDLIYADLCYRIMGVLFDVWGKIGCGHRERVYQKAVTEGLKQNGFTYAEQVPATISYNNTRIGTYYFDFLVEKNIVLELKVREYFSKHDIDQLYSYLKAKDLKLGLIAHFTKSGVKFRRVVNLQ